jgi:hypothetical protein
MASGYVMSSVLGLFGMCASIRKNTQSMGRVNHELLRAQ